MRRAPGPSILQSGAKIVIRRHSAEKEISEVERYFTTEGGAETVSGSRPPVIQVSNYVVLGQLTALRFLEWAGRNPDGVAALPTGRTPEYFIKWVQYYLAHWEREAKSGLLARLGPDLRKPPELRRLRFVQLDEFFPINPAHERSFGYFVRKFYLEGFGLDPAKALLIDTYSLPKEIAALSHRKNVEAIFPEGVIDLGLRVRQPESESEELQRKVIRYFDRFCEEYEDTIRGWGGIGFFLGGIGPDGHVAFNVRGASHRSTTRMDRLNYESMAAASVDLGGIDAARKKAVITIGLGTITCNPEVTAIVMAAGETKAKIVAAALENPPGIDHPASVLQGLPNARFYLTAGAASRLKERRFYTGAASVSARDLERLAVDGALSQSAQREGLPAPLMSPEAVPADGGGVPEWRRAVELSGLTAPELLKRVSDSIRSKIQKGTHLPDGQRFLHTAPHHDDIELAYFPLIHHLVRSERNENYFCYLTSGFTAVTNGTLLKRLEELSALIGEGGLGGRRLSLSAWEGEPNQQEIHGYLNAIAEQNREAEAFFVACRLHRMVAAYLGGDPSGEAIQHFLDEQLSALKKLSPGQTDPEGVRNMKSWLREWEAELAWAHFGLGRDHVHHLRLKFYTGDIFPEDPDFERDVRPILDLMEKVRPTVVTLAMDPEGSGPDTHFKCLIAVARALEEYVKIHGAENLRIYGYRNIWSRFHIAEADVVIPVSLNSFAVLHNMFDTCFASQRTAAFPSHELDGTFSRLAQKIWVEQHQDLIRLLGRPFFYGGAHPLMRRAYGALYLKDMDYQQFQEEIAPLKRFLESKRQLAVK